MNLTRGPGEKHLTFMMKKMSYLAAAFVLGVLLCVTINACGGDTERVEPGGTQNPGGGSGGDEPSGNTGREIHNWEILKFSTSEDYDENGQLTSKIEYKYNDKGWLVGYTQTSYQKSSTTGNYYLRSRSSMSYIYSPSGDYRTSSYTLILYNEDGSILNTGGSTSKQYVYQQ